jgi:AcrR family transcriptional regulator
MTGVKRAKSPRPYRSPRREAQARATREAILDAARRRFATDGYVATTIDAVAADADVSPATVYTAFGSKRALLTATADTAVVGDTEPVPLAGRKWVQDLHALAEPADRVRVLFAGLRAVYERTSALEAAVEEAAATDTELAALYAEYLRRQRQDAKRFRSLIAKDRTIFPGVSPEHDSDAVWTIAGPATYRRLTNDCGWTPAQWENWIVALTNRLLD